jgi:hypothetical protein
VAKLLEAQSHVQFYSMISAAKFQRVFSTRLKHRDFNIDFFDTYPPRPATLVNMSSRRLVNRGRINENSLPAQRSRHREPEVPHEPTPLPPYEPPSCALTPSAKRALDNLRANHDYSKYKRHLDGSIKALTNSVGDSNERLRFRKEALEKAKERRARAGDEEEGKTEAEEACGGMESNVATLTRKAEQALRELIDYGDELAMKDTIMGDVSENVAAAPPRPVQRQRRQGSHEDENGENEEAVEEYQDPEVDGSIVSAVELLKQAQEEYAAEYAAKSMRARYSRIICQIRSEMLIAVI